MKTAVAQLEAARNEVDRRQPGNPAGPRRKWTQARDRFQAGVANNIEVVTAQDELARANDNQIGALYRYNQARADLAHAVGQMEALYASRGRIGNRRLQVHDVAWHRGVSPWIIAMTVMLATFMEVLDTSVANVSLPHIAGNLSASMDESTWVLTSYLVANAIILPMGGWFSMLLGRKRFYMICVALFTISSFLCGIAPTLGPLIFFRVLQGMGGGALQPVSQAILVESFPREKQGMAMAVFGMGVVVAPVIGPTLGGWITDNYTWRWIFFINIPVGILSLVLTTVLIFDPPYLVRKASARLARSITWASGCWPWAWARSKWCWTKARRKTGSRPTSSSTFAVIMVVCLVAVVFWELRQKHPIIDFRVLKDRNFALATFTMLVLGFVLYASTALLPLFLQTLLGYTAMMSGLVLSPGGLVVVVCLPVVGMLMRSVQPRWLVIFGVVVSSLGLFRMAQLQPGDRLRHGGLGAHGAEPGHGVSVRADQRHGVRLYPQGAHQLRHRAFQSGAQHRRQFGNRHRHHRCWRGASQFHQSVLVAHLTPYDWRYRERGGRHGECCGPAEARAPDAAVQAQGMIYGSMLRQSSMLAFADAFG